MSLDKNPYSWKEENITGTVGSLSLTRLNGTVIPVENLPEEIEVISHTSLDTYRYFGYFNFRSTYFLAFQILLPRLDVEQESSTVLDLANFSTLMIDVPSSEVTLVLKMEPSEDISFFVFLGYQNYPNSESYVAKTQIPLENTNEGKSSKYKFWFCHNHILSTKIKEMRVL